MEDTDIAGAMAAVLSLGWIAMSPAGVASTHPATGVGSCTLKNWNPDADPDDATNLPEGQRPQSYKSDDYDCTGAKFADPDVEFSKFPQPKNFQIINKTKAGTGTQQSP